MTAPEAPRQAERPVKRITKKGKVVLMTRKEEKEWREKIRTSVKPLPLQNE
jgi:hypothetical protein